METVVVLDFGSQYTQLIARRIRELGVYTEIRGCDTPLEEIRTLGAKGIILSGGPRSLQEQKLPFDEQILDSELPVLGICYGMQLMNFLKGGSVEALEKGEYGKQRISHKDVTPLLRDISEGSQVWMSHRDSVSKLASDYVCVATSDDGLVAAIAHKERPQWGLQFHPEVTHSSEGAQILSNFLAICECARDWDMQHYLEHEVAQIRQKVGDGSVFSLVSGGVDSTVATALCVRALGSERVHALYVDTGMMRKDESQEVRTILEAQGLTHLRIVDRSKDFLEALKGVSHPEEKRRIIGTLFIKILEEEMDESCSHFCQGTLYTDLIESGKGCGKQAAVIKTHHNVNPPIVEKKRAEGLIVEPNSEIFKDEVRALGEVLGLPEHMVWRHPFPGPGLGIRVLGEVTEEALHKLREADAIYLEAIRNAGLYREIWQAFAVLIPVLTVGVMGDQRMEGNVIALRAITSHDGMTADSYRFPEGFLEAVSTRIVNEIPGVTRVVYDVTSKPPATIEWE